MEVPIVSTPSAGTDKAGPLLRCNRIEQVKLDRGISDALDQQNQSVSGEGM
jgi:hypothetical protein